MNFAEVVVNGWDVFLYPSANPTMSITPSPSTPISNLALKCKASMSTTSDNAPASRAVDGNTDGNFYHNSVVHSKRKNDWSDWWKVDLKSDQNRIMEVIVYARTDCCTDRTSNLIVEILDSAGVVCARRKIGKASAVNKLEFGAGVVGKTVKLSGGMMNFAEVVVNGWDVFLYPSATPTMSIAPSPSTPISNLALKCKASMSTTSDNAPASRAVDGNTDGNFYHNSVVHSKRKNDWSDWW